jgi:hypothetical protein
MLYYFKNYNAERGMFLCEEGKPGDKVWILDKGSIIVEKKFLNVNNVYFQEYLPLQISMMEEASFFGEEILFSSEINNNSNNNSSNHEEKKEQSYKYTVRVNSVKASFYYILKKDFKNKFPGFVLQDLNEKLKVKEKQRLMSF